MVRSRSYNEDNIPSGTRKDLEKQLKLHRELVESVSGHTSLYIPSHYSYSTTKIEPIQGPSFLSRIFLGLRTFVQRFHFPYIDSSRRKGTQREKLKHQNVSSRQSIERMHYDTGLIVSRQTNNLGLERQSCESFNQFNQIKEIEDVEMNQSLEYFNTTIRPPTAFGPSLIHGPDEKSFKYTDLQKPCNPKQENKNKESRTKLVTLPPRPPILKRRERLVFSNPNKPEFDLVLANPPLDHSTSLGTFQTQDKNPRVISRDCLGRISRPHMSYGIRVKPQQTIIPTLEEPPLFLNSTQNGSYRENFHRQIKLATSVYCKNSCTSITAEQMMCILQLEEDEEETFKQKNEFDVGDIDFDRRMDFRDDGCCMSIVNPESEALISHWENVQSMYFPLYDSIPRRSGPSFPIFDKKINTKTIKGKHVRANVNRLRSFDLRSQANKFKVLRWEQRRIIGLFKKKLREENNFQSMKIERDLTTYFHHINWFSCGKDHLNYVGRYFDMVENRLVAIKIFGYGFIRSEKQRLESKISGLTEINALAQIQCVNVVQMLAYFELNSRVYLVTEACDHSLRSEIQKATKGVHPKMAQGVIRQIVIGLDFCHNLGCLHRNICPENILVTSESVVKLADFDKSIFLTDDDKEPCPPPGTITYGAPELLIRNSEYGLAADIWSIGCLLGELLKGIPIWKYSTESEQLHRIQNTFGAVIHNKPNVITYSTSVRKGIRSLREMLPRMSEDAISFVSKCLELEPKKRSTCEGLLQHNFLKHNREGVEAKPVKQSMAEAILPRTELWTHRPHSAPLAIHMTTFSCNSTDSNTYGKQKLNPISPESQSDLQSDSVCEQITISEEKPKERKRKRSRTTKVKKPSISNVETLSSGRSNPVKQQYVPSHIKDTSQQSSYHCASDSSSQVPSILKKGESKTQKKKMTKVTFADDIKQVSSSCLCAAQIKGESLMSHLNSSTTPRVVMKDIINSIHSSSGSTVAEYTIQLKRLHKTSPKLFASHIGSLVAVLLNQIALSKSKVAGPSIKILRALYDFAAKILESEIDRVVYGMLAKLGGPLFIDTECCDILQQIVKHTNPVRACLAFVTAGANQKLGVGRATSAKYLCDAIRKLNFTEDIGDETCSQRRLASHLFDAGTRFTRDNHLNTKDLGKEIFRLLLPHPKFWRLYSGNVQEDQRSRINLLLDEIRGVIVKP